MWTGEFSGPDTRWNFLQFITLDLAGNGLGQAVTEHHNTGILVGCGVFLNIVLNFIAAGALAGKSIFGGNGFFCRIKAKSSKSVAKFDYIV